MAVPDQAKVSSRSGDRASENAPRRANDAVAGSVARVLALQRTLGNRATTELLRARHLASGLLQRTLRDKSGVVSGLKEAPLDEQSGRQIIEEFSRNDPRSVERLVGVPDYVKPGEEGNLRGKEWALDDREWGLIRENETGEIHLIMGTRDQTAWEKYKDEGVPLAHSHPWYWKRSIRQAISIKPLLGGGESGLKVLPTISDFTYPAGRGQTSHTVYTPYVVDAADANDVKVRNPEPADAQTQRLVWVLTEIVLDEPNNQVTGRLTATSGGRSVWTSRVQASTADRRGAKYTVIGQ